ncbi:MFS transporter [Nocardioides bruguierae]|uniref:MFS transporter n=1 Tax=Nocardioides bruguierae TaxID=2945102 RepID=A0A9X2D7N3_9ACTN|nr:MFS transporter [Nocardioides bruguierae]MCM0620876.1 MFS transporter [Nocardioides bruguierae]
MSAASTEGTVAPATADLTAEQRQRDNVAIVAIPVAMLGLMIAIVAPLLVSLALRLTTLDATSSAANLSLVLGIGAFVAFVVNPIAGRLSDRTTSRLGQRKPWIFAGAVISYVGIVVIAFAPGVWAVVLGWSISQLGFNLALAPLVAMLPDQVSQGARGKVASLISLAQNGSAVIGTYFVQLFAIGLTQSLLPSLIGLVVLVLAVLPIKDVRRAEPPTDRLSIVSIFASFVFDPRKHPDLGWAWVARFCLITTQFTATSYLTYFVIDELGYSVAEAATKVFQGTLLNALGILLTTFFFGWLSDRTGRRKPFVLASAVVAALGLGIMATAGTLTVLLVAELVLGMGMGAFLAVDLALVSDVLPDDGQAGKDLGVINIAQALPQSLVPVVAPAVVAGVGYPGLFLGGAAFGVLGGLAVLMVRGVR